MSKNPHAVALGRRKAGVKERPSRRKAASCAVNLVIARAIRAQLHAQETSR